MKQNRALKVFFETSIEFLKGVGPTRAEVLKQELGISTFHDLIRYYPFRYVDRTKIYKISEVNDQMLYIQLKGKISSVTTAGAKRATRLIAHLRDETGTMELVWFRGITWMREIIKAGGEYIVFGKPTSYNGKINIAHPEIEAISQKEFTL